MPDEDKKKEMIASLIGVDETVKGIDAAAEFYEECLLRAREQLATINAIIAAVEKEDIKEWEKLRVTYSEQVAGYHKFLMENASK